MLRMPSSFAFCKEEQDMSGRATDGKVSSSSSSRSSSFLPASRPQPRPGFLPCRRYDSHREPLRPLTSPCLYM